MALLALTLAVLCLVLAVALVWAVGFKPLLAIERLVDAIAANERPRTFLVRGNPVARRVGLKLEGLSDQTSQLIARSEQDEFSVRTILAALPDALLVVDAARRVQLVNPRARVVFHQQEIRPGVTLLEATRDAAIDRAAQEAITDRQSRRVERQAGAAAVAARELEVIIEPIQEDAAAVGGAVLLVRDVTEIKDAERMRRDFVANVSHELRTPLSIFRGYLETLLDNPKQPPDELLRILETMERHSKRLSSLVEDVLSLAQLEASELNLQLEELDLSHCVLSVVRDWRNKFDRKQLAVTVDVQPQIVITADGVRIQEVLYNLIDNAVKYSNPKGSITISLHADGNAARISVKDTGIGIPARDLPRIFERFYRVDKARSREAGGTGLGLSIVKHIAQLHGGTVQASSKLGEGTTITVSLPSQQHSTAAAR